MVLGLILGVRLAPISMTIPASSPSITTDTPTTPRAPSLGARLAATSRQAQGLSAAVSDPTVLAGLRELCKAPRFAKRVMVEDQEGLCAPARSPVKNERTKPRKTVQVRRAR